MVKEIRKSAVAGQFYPSNKEELEKLVKNYLVGDKDEGVSAVISPHAGYPFSGKLMGEVLNKFSGKNKFILLGVNHSGIGSKVCFSGKDFETPLGIVENDIEFGRKIKNKLKVESDFNEESHKYEHSLEVLLPFLQLSQEKFKIVPILLRNLNYEECLEIDRVIESFLKENIGFIVSSDFTHFGETFGFVPFTEDVKENLYEMDGEVIKKIKEKDSLEVFNLASKSTICGGYGLTIITGLAKIKKWNVEKIDYYTSGDITKDWRHVVGYGGLVFR